MTHVFGTLSPFEILSTTAAGGKMTQETGKDTGEVNHRGKVSSRWETCFYRRHLVAVSKLTLHLQRDDESSVWVTRGALNEWLSAFKTRSWNWTDKLDRQTGRCSGISRMFDFGGFRYSDLFNARTCPRSGQYLTDLLRRLSTYS